MYGVWLFIFLFEHGALCECVIVYICVIFRQGISRECVCMCSLVCTYYIIKTFNLWWCLRATYSRQYEFIGVFVTKKIICLHFLFQISIAVGKFSSATLFWLKIKLIKILFMLSLNKDVIWCKVVCFNFKFGEFINRNDGPSRSEGLLNQCN